VNELNDQELNDKKLFVGRFQKKFERVSLLRNQFEEKRNERFRKFAGINLYVKNLDDKIDDERLKKEFSAFGQITSARVNYNTIFFNASLTNSQIFKAKNVYVCTGSCEDYFYFFSRF
jgi:RNA recognition motif-containing protein